jgi:4-hydroxy-2-oxoheptanedioate aldolase
MRPSRIKRKLRCDEPVLITGLHFTDPSLFELTSLMGFDGIWMDMEHHSYSLESAAQLMRAARVGASDILIRPAKGEFMNMGRMLEAGAHAIMYPRCDNAKEAAEVVRWAKFAPVGTRGFDGAGADMPYCSMPVGEYIAQANDETVVIIQLEDQNAVEAADEIAAVEGVDALMLGIADYSILAGVPGQFDHPKVRDAIHHVAEAAKRQGKHWGTPSANAEHCRRLMDLGARIHYHGADIVAMRNALANIQREFGVLGFEFDNRLTNSGGNYADLLQAKANRK